MIEVVIRHKESGAELGRITIENLTDDGNADVADYSVQFGVEKIGSVGLHRRGVLAFPRKQYNVLALLRQALATLEPAELELEGDYEDRTYKKHRLGLLRRHI